MIDREIIGQRSQDNNSGVYYVCSDVPLEDGELFSFLVGVLREASFVHFFDITIEHEHLVLTCIVCSFIMETKDYLFKGLFEGCDHSCIKVCI